MRLIGITGKARSGKDTIGRWFRDYRGAYVTSFAWPIKAGIEKMFSLPADIWDGPQKEYDIDWLGVSPRYLAQTLGTEWGRAHVDPDVWVKALEQRLREARVWYQDCTIVLTDCRFVNEAQWVRQNGHLLHVTRPGADGEVGVKGHASENGVLPEPGDRYIDNDGTELDLIDKLVDLYPEIHP
jgi:hypothetical protein